MVEGCGKWSARVSSTTERHLGKVIQITSASTPIKRVKHTAGTHSDRRSAHVPKGKGYLEQGTRESNGEVGPRQGSGHVDRKLWYRPRPGQS